jgi:hypothetical protein
MMPALVPEAARRRLLADHEGRDVVVEHRLERPAADATGVGKASADQPGLRGHVRDHELDMGHVLDRVLPSALQRQPRECGHDRLDPHRLRLPSA